VPCLSWASPAREPAPAIRGWIRAFRYVVGFDRGRDDSLSPPTTSRRLLTMWPRPQGAGPCNATVGPSFEWGRCSAMHADGAQFRTRYHHLICRSAPQTLPMTEACQGRCLARQVSRMALRHDEAASPRPNCAARRRRSSRRVARRRDETEISNLEWRNGWSRSLPARNFPGLTNRQPYERWNRQSTAIPITTSQLSTMRISKRSGGSDRQNPIQSRSALMKQAQGKTLGPIMSTATLFPQLAAIRVANATRLSAVGKPCPNAGQRI